jgi:hypothetical protein
MKVPEGSKLFDMIARTIAVSLLLLCAACRQQRSDSRVSGSPPLPDGAYFKTHWQDESQFIVETITADLAEMLYFAKNGALPDPSIFSVAAVETQAGFRVPHYRLEVKVDRAIAPVSVEINVDRPIWEPEIYQPLLASLARSLGLGHPTAGASEEEKALPLELLRSPTAANILTENRELSKALQNGFQNPLLHERAALLIGLFGLRECSGDFYDVRTILCRATAHLALGRYFKVERRETLHGRVAETLLSTLMNNRSDALRELAKIETSSVDLKFFVRSMKARNSLDYRNIKLDAQATLLERVSWCYAYAQAVDSDLAWKRLSERERQEYPEYCRIINSLHYDIETGHQLVDISVPLELKEIQQVYDSFHQKAPQKGELIRALNDFPERCFSVSAKAPATVNVIGWGQWAMFLQRELCHAVEQNFNFLERKYAVPEQASTFSEQCDKLFNDLRLYPFVRRFNCTDSQSYHRSMDDGFIVTVNTPHMVSPQCWNYLCYTGPNKELYKPNPNPHVNEWHKHNPPPGTAYDPLPRMNHRSLIERSDSILQIEKLHQIAPSDRNISFNLVRLKYKGQETFEQVAQIYQPVLEFSSEAMGMVADRAHDHPLIFEKISLSAAQLDPSHFFALADYFAGSDERKAAEYLEQGLQTSPDDVSGSYRAPWLVKYYLRNGEPEKARRLADRAAEIYSGSGLRAKAEFLELTGQTSEAFEWYQKRRERYGARESSNDLLAFCYRQSRNTNDSRYEKIWRSKSMQVFPRGVEGLTSLNLQEPPNDGVIVRAENRLVRQNGLQVGDVIVGVYGVRVRNLEQYLLARHFSLAPQIDLLVWRGTQYHTMKVSPPEHNFGAKFTTYGAAEKRT